MPASRKHFPELLLFLLREDVSGTLWERPVNIPCKGICMNHGVEMSFSSTVFPN